MALFSVIYNTPLFYQVVLNLSAAGSGVRLIPNSIGSSIGSLGYGILMAKTVSHYLDLINFTGALLLAGNVDIRSPIHWNWTPRDIQHLHRFMATIYLRCSCSDRSRRDNHHPSHRLNLCRTSQRLVVARALLIIDQATATGMSYLFRSTGQVVGITTTQCVLQNLLKVWLTDRIRTPNAEFVSSRMLPF